MASDIIGTANHGPLFDPVPTATMPGAGAVARQVAREKVNAAEGRATVLAAVRGAPNGLTRLEIHRATGLPIGTVNARVAECCDARRFAPEPPPLLTHGTRETWLSDEARHAVESIVHARTP